jgi:hypothetical protein
MQPVRTFGLLARVRFFGGSDADGVGLLLLLLPYRALEGVNPVMRSLLSRKFAKSYLLLPLIELVRAN